MKSFLLLIIFCLLFIHISFSQVTCNNWLRLSNFPDGVTIGDLDMTGNKITVEAIFNRTQSYLGGPSYAGDLVSKHLNRLDCNYLLRPGHAEITTTNGFFATPEACEIKLNKTYHAAMVYDGSTLKFYRNGYLMGQINATGEIITNDWLTKIGETAGPNPDNTQFLGFINEVRIWKVARTQEEIRANMDSSLPNPATQPGLVAYYTFDNLLNKQGNPTWNGSIIGAAVINATNTSCTFIADSCAEIGSGGGGTDCSVNAGKDVTVCNPGQVQLNADGGVSYIWSPSTGLSNANIANPVATVSSTTTYIVTGTTATGCVDSDTITITLAANPIVKASNDTTICASINSPETLQLTATGAQTFTWSPSAGLSNAAIANPLATISATTKYIVTGTTQSGCSAKDTITINVLAKPVVSLTNDTVICQSGSVQLLASGGQSYQWFPSTYLNDTGIPNPISTPFESTKYFVTVTSENNCSSKDSINIVVKGAGKFDVTPKSVTICSDSSVRLIASGGDIYIWQPSNSLSNPVISNPIANPDSSTIYKVLIKDSYCSIDTTLSVQVNVNPKPIITVSKDGDFNCNKTTVQLSASGGTSYTWTPSSGLNNPNIPNPVATVPANTTFYVSTISTEGCTTNDSIRVSFDGSVNQQAFLLPTAFTPNGDGINDCFGIKKWGSVQVIQMEIYNRWGELIFKGKNYSDCWDGRFKGVMQPTGAFPYIIKVKTGCGTVENKGTVILLR